MYFVSKYTAFRESPRISEKLHKSVIFYKWPRDQISSESNTIAQNYSRTVILLLAKSIMIIHII